MKLHTLIVQIQECGSCSNEHESVEFVDPKEGDCYITCPTTGKRVFISEEDLPGAYGLSQAVDSLHNYCTHLEQKIHDLGCAVTTSLTDGDIEDSIDVEYRGALNRVGKLSH